MAPARPAASRSTGRTASEEQQYVQAGRSATALNAAASAYSLHQQARKPNTVELRSSASTPNLLRKKSRPRSQLQGIDDVSDTELPDPTAKPANFSRPHTSSGPAKPPKPAKLISTSSNDSSSSSNAQSRKVSAESSPDSRPRASPDTRPRDGPAPITIPPIPPIPGTESQPPSRPMTARSATAGKRDSQISVARLGTPRSVRDLGTDYDRYYNPFGSRSNSQLDLSKLEQSSHLLAPGSRSSVDLKRYSNPFADTKRFSSAIHSNVSTRPASPVYEDNEKMSEIMEAESILAAPASKETFSEKPGTPIFIREADPEKTPFYPYVDDRLGNPEYAFPLFVDTKEDDDDMHMPAWDDDIRWKPKLRDHFSRENIASTFGMLLMMLGLLCVFVVLPVVSYTGTSLIPYGYDTPLDQMPGPFKGVDPNSWAYVNDNSYPLLTNMRTGLIDPDTPSGAMSRTDINGNTLQLVYSDEFNEKNRTFYPGDDPYWYGFNGWYGATQDLEWYDPDALNTGERSHHSLFRLC